MGLSVLYESKILWTNAALKNDKMIFSNCLTLTDNQNPLKTTIPPIFWSWVWPCILCWDKLRGDFRKSSTRTLLLWMCYNILTMQPPALAGSLSTEQKNKDLIPVTNPIVSLGSFSCLQKGSWFGYRDMFKNYSSGIQSALTLHFTQKTKHIHQNQWTRISKYFFL